MNIIAPMWPMAGVLFLGIFDSVGLFPFLRGQDDIRANAATNYQNVTFKNKVASFPAAVDTIAS
ncbi:hypothetical protein [Pseudoduganella violaceinigra]|uniref:hypothetical protein n=1 Tax=Pseudoduganella violaceinigra TaxID=246602 RepID=UPI0013776B44|nr:hypothetical protein [Pseudoduganella violaceinigra]